MDTLSRSVSRRAFLRPASEELLTHHLGCFVFPGRQTICFSVRLERESSLHPISLRLALCLATHSVTLQEQQIMNKGHSCPEESRQSLRPRGREPEIQHPRERGCGERLCDVKAFVKPDSRQKAHRRDSESEKTPQLLKEVFHPHPPNLKVFSLLLSLSQIFPYNLRKPA